MLRIKLIQGLIHFNERIFFYPRLKKFYKARISSPHPVIIDVGANKGQTIDFFRGLFKNAAIVAFEPNKELFRLLERKYRGATEIKLFNLGISDRKGKLLFNENVLDETSTFETLNYDSEYLKYKAKILGVKPADIVKRSYEVEVVTLADFLKEQNITEIDVLKIDTEGHEYKCLKGLFAGGSLPDIKMIQLEQHNDDMYRDKTAEHETETLLNKNGYEMFGRVKHGFGDFDEVIYRKK